MRVGTKDRGNIDAPRRGGWEEHTSTKGKGRRKEGEERGEERRGKKRRRGSRIEVAKSRNR
jgi:hypothetical protein